MKCFKIYRVLILEHPVFLVPSSLLQLRWIESFDRSDELSDNTRIEPSYSRPATRNPPGRYASTSNAPGGMVEVSSTAVPGSLG